MIRLIAITLSCLLLSALPALARPIAPVEGLEALRRALQGLQDFSAEITQEKQLAIMKKKLVMQGQVRFRKPDLFLMDLQPPYAGRIVLRDTRLEQRIGRDGELMRIVLPAEQGLTRWLATLARPVTAVPAGMTVRADLQGQLYTVTIAPGGAGQLKEVTVQFQEDGQLRKLMLEERNSDRSVLTFRSMRRNSGLRESDFSMERP